MNYLEPKVEIIYLDSDDIIKTSDDLGDGDDFI